MAADVAAILKLAPLGLQQFKRYRRSNTSKSLDRRVQSELEADPSLGPRVTDSLLTQWYYIHNDPRGAVIIERLLTEGDVAYIAALRTRAGELLAGLETLPIDIDATVERIVRAVANNFVGAQKDEQEAVQTTASAVLSALKPLATREDLDDAITSLAQSLTPQPPRVVLLAGRFTEAQQRHLSDLIETAPEAAGMLGAALAARGVAGAQELVRSPPTWADAQPGAFWRAAAAILTDADQLQEAELAFAREAECPDVEDRVRALIDAARCAEADDPSSGRAAADGYLAPAVAADEQHPLVRLFLADRSDDPEERLRLTDDIDTLDDRQRARKEAQRAFALVALGRYAEAQDAAAACIAAAPHGGGREIATLVTIAQAHSELPSRAPDDRPLMDAVAYQLSLFARASEGPRTAMAGLAGARAALGAATLGDREAALELIDRVANNETMLANAETRSVLVEACLTADDGERAQQLLGPPDATPASRLSHATVAVLTGTDLPTVAAELDALISELEPGAVQTQAIAMRLLAASDPLVEFVPSIADGVPEAEKLLAHTCAARHQAAGDLAAARSLMVQFDDPTSLSIRVDIAEQANQLPEAVGLQTRLVRMRPSAGSLLRLAGLRARDGDPRGAIREAMRVATDERKFRRARERAYALAAQAAYDAGEFEELEDITERWAELSPDRQDPLWAHVIALARQNRHDEALAFARARGLEPTTAGDRHKLWAELVMYGVESGDERMRSLMELSDAFERPVELEQAFIGSVLHTPPADRGDDDPEVIARFQEALSTFEERFPDAGGLQKITVDPDADPAAFLAKLAAAHPTETQEQIDARQEALDGFARGAVPAAFVAAMVGRGTTEMLVRNLAYPLAVFDRPTVDAEVAAAGRALDRADASWDETACVTVAQLEPPLARRIEGLLPGSHIGQAVRDTLSNAVKLQTGGEQVAVMQILPDGTPQFIEERPGIVAKVREVQNGANAIAARLAISPDSTDGAEPQLAELAGRQGEHGPLAALVSAFLAARTRGIPVFSDDRVVRAYARGIGLPAFGSLALIHAAVYRGVVTPAEANEIVRAILDFGIWSTALEPDAYVDVARRAQFDLGRCGRALLADEVLLRADTRLLHNARLLAAIADEAPQQLQPWAVAIVRGYAEILQLDPTLSASRLIAAQLDPSSTMTSDARRSRNTLVIAALRTASGYDSPDPDTDPLSAGVGRWLQVATTAENRAATLEALLAQLNADDAADMRARLG